MSRKRTAPKYEPPARSHFDDLSPHTKQAIAAVLCILIGSLITLAAFHQAGPTGEYLITTLTWLFGWGYVAAPLVAFAYAVVFLKPREDARVSISKVVGVALMYLGLLGGIHIYRAPLHIREVTMAGGLVGYALGTPLLSLLGAVAAYVIVGTLALVGGFLSFNVGLMLPGLFAPHTPIGESEIGDGFSEHELAQVEADIRAHEATQGHGEEEVQDEPAPEKKSARADKASQPKDEFNVAQSFLGPYTPPPLTLLNKDRGRVEVGDVKANANIIKRTLRNFRIHVEMDEVAIGPTVTRYALKPAEGVRLQKIVGLQNNLELALAASPIRIEAPIPGKSLVGVEVPNTVKATVGLGGILAEPEFLDNPKPLIVALGRDISGHAHFANLAKMPHVLIAGTTGSGKSVTIHALVTSLLYRNSPEMLQFIMVDPKRVELTLYNGIPHLLTPVITDPKKALLSLKWAIGEMGRRYDLLESYKVRDISSYHENIYSTAKRKWEDRGAPEVEKDELPPQLPYIVILIDELADLMQQFPREFEASIVRLAQMSRAVGIHLVLSTQRPSVNVVTGLIKANVPSRVALQVASQIDSRTILDQPGAEKLLGQGDMLFLSGELAKPHRLQSAFLTEEEVKKVVSFLKRQTDLFTVNTIELGDGTGSEAGGVDAIFSSGTFDDSTDDALYEEAKRLCIEAGKASTSLLQRRLSIGYGRAAKLLDTLEARGIIGPQNGSKPREVLVGRGTTGEEEG